VKKQTLGIIVAGTIALGGLAVLTTQIPSFANDGTVATAQAEQTKAQFAIENMTCATCPISVKKAMMRVEGVLAVKIDFKTKIATVSYDPAVTTTETIAAASTNVGYPATQKES
jgi:mercuric ion binding protein